MILSPHTLVMLLCKGMRTEVRVTVREPMGSREQHVSQNRGYFLQLSQVKLCCLRCCYEIVSHILYF